MEYIFGTNELIGEEVLKTKGSEHTNLEGFQSVVTEYPDCTIYDSFYVVRKDMSDEDSEGNCYDWYVINRHNRTVDKTKVINSKISELIAAALED